MEKTRDEISKFFVKKCSEFLTDREQVQEYADLLYAKYSMPYTVSIDYLTLKTDIIDATDDVIFFIMSVIDKREIDKFFSPKEKKKYTTSKFKVKKITYPLRFDVIQVAEFQYNGMISSKQLMELRDAQLINYNENTQRPVKHKVFGDVEYYVQDINRKSVEQIKELMKRGAYIPDQITLNLPEEANYYYDEDRKQLVIKEKTIFDITDGNHRYVAMSNAYNVDPDFDYPMELRITIFNEDKTNQFMYQVDQRNKLNKLDIELKNQDNPASRVTMMLNDTRELKDLFSRDKKKIDPGVFSLLLKLLFFNNTKKSYKNPEQVQLKKKLLPKFTAIIDDKPELLESKWSNSFLVCVVYICTTDTDNADIYEEAMKLHDKIVAENKLNLFEKRDFTRTDITRLEKIYSE